MKRTIKTEQFKELEMLVPRYFASRFYLLAFFKLFCIDRDEDDTDNLIKEFKREVICSGRKDIS